MPGITAVQESVGMGAFQHVVEATFQVLRILALLRSVTGGEEGHADEGDDAGGPPVLVFEAAIRLLGARQKGQPPVDSLHHRLTVLFKSGVIPVGE